MLKNKASLFKSLDEFARAFSHEYRLAAVDMATLLREVADNLVAIDDDGALRARPRPAKGMSVRGISHRVIGHSMKWRGILFPEDTIVFEGSYANGTINMAEWMAIADALEWADEHRYTGPIYTESYVAKTWIESGTFGSNTKLSQEMSEKVRRIISILKELPVSQLELWDRDEWGPPPADYFEQNSMKQYEPGGKGRWKG